MKNVHRIVVLLVVLAAVFSTGASAATRLDPARLTVSARVVDFDGKAGKLSCPCGVEGYVRYGGTNSYPNGFIVWLQRWTGSYWDQSWTLPSSTDGTGHTGHFIFYPTYSTDVTHYWLRACSTQTGPYSSGWQRPVAFTNGGWLSYPNYLDVYYVNAC